MPEKKKFTHERGNILLHHEDASLPPTVIATASTGWAKIIADAMNRSTAIRRMVKGVA